MRAFISIFAIAYAMLLVGCARQITEDEAFRILTDSKFLSAVAARIENPSDMRVAIEESHSNEYEFWMYEDRETHAATLERVKVGVDGKLYRLDILNYVWIEVSATDL